MQDGDRQGVPQVDHKSVGEGPGQIDRQQNEVAHAAHPLAGRKVDVRKLLPNEYLDLAIGLGHLGVASTPAWIGWRGFHRRCSDD